ncbi:unnamed protein product, partial [Aphanomyces euteiches]
TMPPPAVSGHDEVHCKYVYKVCLYPRTVKKDGTLHRLCEFHRNKANALQKVYATKRRRELRAQKRQLALQTKAAAVAAAAAAAAASATTTTALAAAATTRTPASVAAPPTTTPLQISKPTEKLPEATTGPVVPSSQSPRDVDIWSLDNDDIWLEPIAAMASVECLSDEEYAYLSTVL